MKKILAGLVFFFSGIVFTAGVFAEPVSADSVTTPVADVAAPDTSAPPAEQKVDEKTVWDRYFEIGVATNANFGNNYFNIKSVFGNNGEIVIDFNEMAKSKLMLEGFKTSVSTNAAVFMNVDVKNVHVGLYGGVSVNTLFLIGKDMINFLANGTELDTPTSLSFGIGASAFLEMGADIDLRFGKLRIQAVPSYFVPVFHAKRVNAQAVLTMGSDGKVTVKAASNVPVYSCLPLDKLFDGQVSTAMVQEALKQGGFDLSALASYRLFSELDVGGYVKSIPIVPARLRYLGTYSGDASFEMDPVMPQVSAGNAGGLAEKIKDNLKYGYTAEQSNAKKHVLRPLRIGAFAAWRPLNSQKLVLSGTLEFRFMDAIIKNNAGFGIGYIVRLHGTFGPFTPFLETAYMDEIFTQEFGFKLNLRALEFDLSVSSQSTNFLKSFAGYGLGVNVAVMIGF